MIDVIGDSHVCMFQPAEAVAICHVGPATAYGLVNDKSTTGARIAVFQRLETNPLKSEDKLVLVFGEIDCRIHIYRQTVLKSSTFRDEVNLALGRYLKFIEDVSHRSPAKLVILGVPPAGSQNNHYGYDYYGEWDERSAISRMWNDALESHVGNRYLDCYGRFSDWDGRTKADYNNADGIHLNLKAGEELLADIRKR